MKGKNLDFYIQKRKEMKRHNTRKEHPNYLRTQNKKENINKGFLLNCLKWKAIIVGKIRRKRTWKKILNQK